VTVTLRPAPSPHTAIRDGGAGRRLVHIENPNQLGHSLCGKRLAHSASAANARCVVCEDMSRPTFWGR
jgi:hypothetical protein